MYKRQVEKGLIESYADSFILVKGADLKKLPNPDNYNRMVEELLSGLDSRLLDLLTIVRPAIISVTEGSLSLARLVKQ